MTDDFGIFERNEEDGVRIFPGDGYFDNVAEDKCDKDGDYLEDYEGCEDKTSQRMERDHERVIQANESFGNAIFTDAKNLE